MGSNWAASPLNKRAGRQLRDVREGLGLEQKEFVVRVSAELGLTVKPAAYSNYESGKRPVPAALLLAAQRLIETDESEDQRLVDLESGLNEVRALVKDLVRRSGEQPDQP